MNKLIYFIFSLITFFNCSAQWDVMAFKNLTTDMGLSHGDVTCIYQDHIGYIWIGTTSGLNKYDGIEFTIYKFNKKDSASLSSSYIICIYEDKKNNLWIGTSIGLCLYNRDNNNFERITFLDNHNNIFENSIIKIFEDNSNRLWIGCGQGVYLLDRETKRFTACFMDSPRTDTLVYCSGICQDKKGIIWLSFKDTKDIGIIKYDPISKATTLYNTQNSESRLKENSVYSMMIDNHDNIWIGYVSNGLDIIDGQRKTITGFHKNQDHYSLNNNSIFSIAQNTDGKILIGTNGGGVNVFDPGTRKFGHYTTSESERSLLSNTIQELYVARDGIIWIGCRAGGVSIYDKRFDRFTLYRHEKQDNSSLFGSSVTCFAQDLNGNIWIATDGGGINFFNTSEKQFINYRSDSKNPQTLTNDKVLAIETDTRGGLWAGMWQGGLNYFQIVGNKLILKKKYKYVDEAEPNSISVFNIYRDKTGEIWVGNFKTGAYLFDPKSDKFKTVALKDTADNIISSTIIRDILCDYKDDMWFATQRDGLIRLNRKTGENMQFVHNVKDTTSLISNSINVIYEDSKKRLWIGTDEDGLSLFNRGSKSFTHYSTDDGLPNNTIVGILEDDRGSLWISSNNGISKATINSVDGKLNITFRNYTVKDGLQSKVFNRWSFFKSRSGEMYFGGINGFNAFHPDSIKDNSFIPPVQITDFLLFNKPALIGAKNSPLNKHISQTKKIVLNYNQSIFTFRFIALNYIFSEKNQYAHIMEGFEKDWNYVENRKEATYTNLDPGEYTFRVKASNNDGIWNEEGTSIKIVIKPPFWKTWWFRSLIILLLILSIIAYINIRVYNIKKQKLLLEKQVRERTEDLFQSNQILEEQQEEILLQKEEILSQNEALVEQKDQIASKNEELESYSTMLEEKVMERTHDLEKALSRAEESDKLKSSFLANMSHEIRTPMNAIVGFSSLLRDEEIDEFEKKDMINIIIQNSESLLMLINNILDLSQIQANQMPLNVSAFNLVLIFEEIQKNFSLDVKKKNILLKANANLISPEFVFKSDLIRFKQVLSNLVNNAIKFTNYGEIEFGVKSITDKTITFFVKDTGIGISADTGSAIFERFTKIENKNHVYSGTGLGLAICKSYVNLWKGEIWYESVLNSGTTFYFSHPLQRDDQIITINPEPHPLIYNDYSDKTILVAEDQRNNYLLIKSYLRKTKVKLIWVQNGYDAIQFALNNPVDLILMDIKMPEVDGIEATQQIKKVKSHIPIIAQTAYAFENEISQFLKHGLDAYLVKPIKLNELIDVLKRFLI